MKVITKLVLLTAFISSLFSAQLNYKDNIDAVKLKEMYKPGLVIVDIRTKQEWQQTGVIKGSRLLTFFDEKGSYDIKKFMGEFVKYVPSADTKAVIICRTGSRSVPVADFLGRMGYKNIYNQKYGIMEWIQRGFPVVAP